MTKIVKGKVDFWFSWDIRITSDIIPKIGKKRNSSYMNKLYEILPGVCCKEVRKT